MLGRTSPLLLIALAISLMATTTGCGYRRNKAETKPARQKATVSVTRATYKPTTGIKVTRLDKITVHAGDSDGIYLGDFVDAIDTQTNLPITELGIGSPKWGSLKNYSEGHIRYYPPSRPCLDEVSITLRGKRGQTKDITLQINVVDASGNIPANARTQTNIATTSTKPSVNRQIISNQSATSAHIDSPENNTRIPKRICPVQGSTTGYADGTRITFYVRSMYGTVYPQGCLSDIYNNEFSGMVYLGDEQGRGIGEPFKVWAKTPDGRLTNTITLIRSK